MMKISIMLVFVFVFLGAWTYYVAYCLETQHQKIKEELYEIKAMIKQEKVGAEDGK